MQGQKPSGNPVYSANKSTLPNYPLGRHKHRVVELPLRAHPVGEGFLLDCLILTYAYERGEGGRGGEEIRKGVELKRVREGGREEGERRGEG